MSGKVERGHGERRYTALHVAAAPTVKLARVGVGGEWIHAPRRDPERHRVDMPGEADWQLVGAAPHGSDQVGAPRPEAVIPNLETAAFQQCTQIMRAGLLTARRVDRVHAHQLAGQLRRIPCCLHARFPRPGSTIASLQRRPVFSRESSVMRLRLWACAVLVNAAAVRRPYAPGRRSVMLEHECLNRPRMASRPERYFLRNRRMAAS